MTMANSSEPGRSATCERSLSVPHLDTTVVIPAYNRERFIVTAVESVLGQTRQPAEIIVVDDGSTDRTAERVAQFGERVRLIQIENNGSGPSRPRNVGIAAAKSEYITVLDSDDYLQPQLLERHWQLLLKQAEVGLVSHNFARRTGRDGVLEPNEPGRIRMLSRKEVGAGLYVYAQRVAYGAMCHGNFLPGSGATFLKTAWEQVGGYDESLRNSNDFDFYLRLFRKFSLGYVDEPLSVYVMHDENISAADRSGVFKPYRSINQMRVLEREIGLARDAANRAALKRRVRTVLAEMAYGYRTLGQYWQSASASVRALRYGANPLRIGIELAKAGVQCGMGVTRDRQECLSHPG